MTKIDRNRRTFLKASGAALTITLAAGCLGSDDDEPQPNTNGDGDGGDDGGNGDDDAATDDHDFGDWFDGVDSYDGVVDMTSEDEVTVMNGAGSSGMEFDPAAIRVDPGTTVVWEWTGDGGGHTVTEDDGLFESDMKTDAGETFEYTFDDAGTYRYYCEPHLNVNQKGAVVVE
ncbi:halocyanin domain-containing protein [Natrononativus amylolyticus]|uniref:halocyanin domain-containing protein n=1 Tax=Natrononativus amylolyticus TaxID=2963434 RepID=UPI0020CBDC1C|nr:halocyanin domain-containing protein [Natrononativus amylolyticus]